MLKFIIDDIKEHLDFYPNSKFIVTGLDRSGKSTMLDKYFSEYHRYKGTQGLFHPTEILNNGFRVFDRTPLIEHYVYTEGESQNDKLLFGHCMRELKPYKNCIFMFFLYPRFRNNRPDEYDYSKFDDEVTKRYHQVAMGIVENVEDSIVIEILPNNIRKMYNVK